MYIFGHIILVPLLKKNVFIIRDTIVLILWTGGFANFFGSYLGSQKENGVPAIKVKRNLTDNCQSATFW